MDKRDRYEKKENTTLKLKCGKIIVATYTFGTFSPAA